MSARRGARGECRRCQDKRCACTNASQEVPNVNMVRFNVNRVLMAIRLRDCCLRRHAAFAAAFAAVSLRHAYACCCCHTRCWFAIDYELRWLRAMPPCYATPLRHAFAFRRYYADAYAMLMLAAGAPYASGAICRALYGTKLLRPSTRCRTYAV